MRQRRGGYDGPAELLVGERSVGTFTVQLQGYVERGGLRSWEGRLVGMPSGERFPLAGETVTIRTPDGREGSALVPDLDGQLLGSGPAPFDV